jgi:BirA family biotin operon repressor/biotin-[acetyl-CoA-carboxylase] ligase
MAERYLREGFKVVGILIEYSIIRNEIDHCVAGIGFECQPEVFPSRNSNPTSMSIITGREYDVEQCISDLCQKLDARYKQLIYNKTGRIEEDYKSSLYRLNHITEFRDSRGIFEGRIISVSDSGRLHNEDRRGRIYEYGFREVDFL